MHYLTLAKLTLGIAFMCFSLSVLGQKADRPFTSIETVDETDTTHRLTDEEPVNWKFRRGAWEVGIEAGFAPMQPTFFSGEKEYDTEGRKFGGVSIHAGKVIGTKGPVTYEYLFEAIPLAIAIKNEVTNPAFISEEETPDVAPTVRENTYAWGVMPAGFRFIFRPEKRLKPYVRVGAGFVFSSKPIPVPESPSYNFAGDFGGGVMYSVNKRQAVTFGYRYFHISNMNIGEINPGYNANVFYVGYSWFSK